MKISRIRSARTFVALLLFSSAFNPVAHVHADEAAVAAPHSKWSFVELGLMPTQNG